MAFDHARGKGTISLSPPSAYRPHYRLDFNSETHRLFSSEILALDSQKRYYASVCIPKTLLQADFSLDRPVQVKGALTLHLLAEDTLEWQLDVDWISMGGLASLVGHLHVELVSEPTTIVQADRHEAWIVDQLLPIRRQFWLNRHPIDVLSSEGLYRWFAIIGHWSVTGFAHEDQPWILANVCFSEGIPLQKLCTLLIDHRGNFTTRSVIRFPPHAALDIDRAVLETQVQAPHEPSNLPIHHLDQTISDLSVSNGEVNAALPAPLDNAEANVGPVLPIAIPQPPIRIRTPRRRPTPRRSTNRQALDLRLKGHKLERALKQLGAEHMSEHIAVLVATTKPGATTRSKRRAHIQFSTGPLVGTRAQRRQLAAAA